MTSELQTRFAKRADVHLAFQTRGEGPGDILVVPVGFVPIDSVDDDPKMARLNQRLA